MVRYQTDNLETCLQDTRDEWNYLLEEWKYKRFCTISCLYENFDDNICLFWRQLCSCIVEFLRRMTSTHVKNETPRINTIQLQHQ